MVVSHGRDDRHEHHHHSQRTRIRSPTLSDHHSTCPWSMACVYSWCVGYAVQSQASVMNLNAKSIALRCVLKVFTMLSIEASSLSTPSRYARRYARALRANLRDVASGSAARDIDCRISSWSSYLGTVCAVLTLRVTLRWRGGSVCLNALAPSMTP